MKQFFIFGASSVYGVGAEHDGWGDLVKTYLHAKMYGRGGTGETHEVFNFSKAGSTVEFIAGTADWIYEHYGRGEGIITLISVGGNDAKAEDTPDNFVCTPEDFRARLTGLIEVLQKHSQRVIFVSNGFVDETKTNPKPSPFKDGKASYFTNERRTLFNNISKQICKDNSVDFVAVDTDKATWIKNYLYADGPHPNQAGYQKVFKALQPVVDTCI